MKLSSLAYVGAFLSFAAIANATPITYQVMATASGQIGGTPFTNALVTVMAFGNTAGIVAEGGGFFAEALNKTTVTIQGIGTATITVPTEIVSSGQPIIPQAGFPDLPYVIIGRTDNPPALDSLTGIGGIGSNALLGYDLSTPIGPLTASPGGVGFETPCGTPQSDPCLQTTLGFLSFTANISPTGEGTFAANPVPEPASMLLLGTGLIGVGVRRRNRRQSK